MSRNCGQRGGGTDGLKLQIDFGHDQTVLIDVGQVVKIRRGLSLCPMEKPLGC